MLSSWIRAHLELAVHPFKDRYALRDLEDQVLLELDPPLNLEGMKVTPLRATLSLLRASLSEDPSGAIEKTPAPPSVATARRTDPATRSPMHVNTLIQEELRRRGLAEVPAAEAARWLDGAAVLADSDHRPGLPLRNLLRAGLIKGAEQRPPRANGRWFITQIADEHDR
jgi:hypothetical protein